MTDYDPRLKSLTTYQSIAPGKQGTVETLHVMRALAVAGARDPIVRMFANQFANQSKSAAVASLDQTLRKIYRYRDEIEELIRTPRLMVDDLYEFGFMEGDCDDIATFSASVLKVLGIPCRLVAIRTVADDPYYKHVFVEVSVDGQWVRVDPTVTIETNLVYYGQRLEQRV